MNLKLTNFLQETIEWFAMVSPFAAVQLFLYIKYFFIDRKYGENLENCVGKLASKPKMVIIIVPMCVISILCVSFYFGAGNTQIGSIFEKHNYQEKYYVYVTENTKQSKRYKIPADIYRIRGSVGDYTYFVQKIYWPNGGYIDFTDNDNIIGEKVIPLKEIEVDFSSEHNPIYITLTTEKVN